MVCGQSNYPKAELYSQSFIRNLQSFSLDLVLRDVVLSPLFSSRTAEGQAKVLNASAVYT